MNRREFLKLGAVAAALPAAKSIGADAAAAGALPPWAVAKINEAVARFKAWKGKDDVVSFIFVTDVHSRLTEISPTPVFSNSRYHVLFAQAAADQAGCDFLVDGGDHDYDNGRPSPEEALKRMAVTRHVYEGYKAKPVLFCLGNHDHGSYPADKKSPRPISSQLFGDTFNGLAEKHGFKIVFGDNRSWGYYDVPGRKFRAIFCNTSDDGYYGFSVSQLDFIKNALHTMPADWTGAAFGHFCVFSEIGHWKGFGSTEAKRRAEFMSILEGFVKERPNSFAGYFCGDSHFDNEMEWHGVNWTIFQGYGGVGRASKPWGARTVPFNRANDMLFDIVAVKPSAGEFKIFRVGAGGPACDRLCVYHNKFPK
jgi:hypothetical protein